jgi:hypothetical protein
VDDAAMLVFEIGIAERQMIDNGPSLLKGWAFYLANCQVYNQICLSGQYSLENEIIRPVSSNKPGTTMNGVFGILINRERDEFSLISNNIVVGKFTAVTSNVTLCPVFGIYNAHIVSECICVLEVSMLQILTVCGIVWVFYINQLFSIISNIYVEK